MRVLCVDLDGTLIKTDTLHEKVVLLLKKNCLNLFLIVFWALQGRALLKKKLCQIVSLPVELLPYNESLLDWLKLEKAKGRKLALVTAADRSIAEKVSKHLGIFDEVFASDGKVNLKSTLKAKMLADSFGRKNYDYVGDSSADMKVWEGAQKAYIVSASKRFIRNISRKVSVEDHFLSPRLTLKSFLKAIRVHQYTKNLLLFVPLVTGHYIFNDILLLQMLRGFICFCFMASSVYLLNDLLDLMSDRQHPNKSRRAIASGLLSIKSATILMVFFLGMTIVVAWGLPWQFNVTLLTYYILTLMYSFYLKQQLLMDVVTLSALYTLRVVAGMALITFKAYSLWLILFSMFLFLSFAFLKRVSELAFLKANNREYVVGRAYQGVHSHLLMSFGVSSGFLSMLILALYLSTSTAEALYMHPYLLLLLFPILIYWLCRIWLLAVEGKVQCDPVQFVVTDYTSYVCGFLIFAVMLVAIF